MNQKELSVSRSKDRKELAERIATLARNYGATVEIETEICGEREIVVKIEAQRGLRLNVDLDGDDRQQRGGTWVLSWHMDTMTDTCLSDTFGNINNVHFRKATYIAYGIYGPRGLFAQIEQGLSMAKDGSAFCLEREAAGIAKWGRAKDRWANLSKG